ncbi:hypothetical protein QE361_002733 [Sphingomonas sp. SORGH_AS802]|uniref:DUF4062 domain-containing protein n=1 Tax=Sphingomonas sp. SORGH_AS_0802 TaxID=3041800 RepID=UPI00285F6D77|nr:DUF4062 domain-containing protein [Sphingomonas sp. SORGH_AS_0802]MDR6135738.1 hypothetical protein [Sphingomonas sp. SORGH_AS_0802]
MEKKYQIFVSSTFTDLKDERQDAIRSILDLRHIPAGMELFPAVDKTQLTYIKKVIDECDYYVLIMGGRYGSIDEAGVSFTEREYDYAYGTGKTILAFPYADINDLARSKTESTPEAMQALEKFRAKVMAGRLVREWKTKEQLETLVIKSLVHAFAEAPAEGWVRGGTAASEDLLAQINQLRDRNDALLAENRDLMKPAINNIDNLAPMDAPFEIKFIVRRLSQEGFEQLPYTLRMTWNEIFCVVGAAINAPQRAQIIADSLVAYFTQKHRVSNTTFIENESVSVIERHLMALGLIRLSTQEGKAPGLFIPIISLTDGGSQKLTELLAVRG